MKRYLTILQLENYNIIRYIRWLFNNIGVKKIEYKKDLKYTPKIKLIIGLSVLQFLYIIYALFSLTHNILITTVFSILFLTQFYLFFIISTMILLPIDYYFISRAINKTKQKILHSKKLQTIAITGSYGKTSTKEILYQLIKDKFKTLRTPESYNTILGIAKTIEYELDKTYEIFICEMAAYKKNDIKILCNMVQPHYGVITGLTSQHLERFGNFQNIIEAKFGLYDSIYNKNNIIFNLSNKHILSEIKKRNINKPNGYINASNIVLNKYGTSFEIKYKNKIYKIKTSLFGFSNIENILGALTMALKLNLEIGYLISKIENLNQISNRFELKKFGESTIVDNTFSSNEISFKEMLKTARKVNGTKVLITPGLVELGIDEAEKHYRLGLMINRIFDTIILVGNSNRTKSIAKGLKGNFEFIDDTRNEYVNKVNQLKNKYDWIFLENDLTQNYN